MINATGDADYDIVQAAVRASQLQSTTLIGEDTDLLILLLHHFAEGGNRDLYFRSDKTQDQSRVYHINRLKSLLGSQASTMMLFVHDFTGCDTTSRIFGVGKKSLFQKVMKGDAGLRSCAQAFATPGQSTDAIVEIGYKAMVQVFGGKGTDTLTSLRHSILTKKVVSAVSFVTTERLPPTEAATKA